MIMNTDAFSVSGFYRWNRNDDLHIAQACAEFAQAGTRFLAADAETVKKIIDKCKSILFLIAKACENHEIREIYY